MRCLHAIGLLLLVSAPAFAKGPRPGLYRLVESAELGNGTRIGPKQEVKCESGGPVSLLSLIDPEVIKLDKACEFLVGPKQDKGRTSYRAECSIAGGGTTHLDVELTDDSFEMSVKIVRNGEWMIRKTQGRRIGDCR